MYPACMYHIYLLKRSFRSASTSVSYIKIRAEMDEKSKVKYRVLYLLEPRYMCPPFQFSATICLYFIALIHLT